MFGAILKATNSSFQKGMPFCRSIYVKKVMKLLAFIFEQPSYNEISDRASLELGKLTENSFEWGKLTVLNGENLLYL